MNQEVGRYRVVLLRTKDDTEAGREIFCVAVSENYGVSYPLMMKIVDRCPIVLKKNLSVEKALTLAKTLKSLGAMVSVEEKKSSVPVFLEFENPESLQVALESASLRRMESGAWDVVGRVKNVSGENLTDAWVLIQLFDGHDELLTFEEIRIPFSPLPPGKSSPFRGVFDKDLPIQRASIAFKASSGYPLTAKDRRQKKEWVEVKIEGEETSQFFDIAFPPEEAEADPDPLERSFAVPESETRSISIEIEKSSTGATEERREAGEDSASSTVAPEENSQERETADTLPPFQASALVLPERETEEGPACHEPESSSAQPQEIPSEIPSDASGSEEPILLLEHVRDTDHPEGEGALPIAWIDPFRSSIETYYQKPRGIFITWFDAHRKGNEFLSPFHSLLVILVHARFDQMNHSEKALENTQRVFNLSFQPDLQLEQIPPLEGTQFYRGEDWRILFYRAIPKLQQVTHTIIAKGRWDALDLERVIQVIPHVGTKNSRMAVRWIHELIPDVITIDFSNALVSIEESVYRVASRLGVVDPHCDFCQGENSEGILKIQSFAKMAFPEDPLKVEEPMIWVGKREDGGHCFPTQPRCKGCLFEAFCPKLHCDFNPSEGGLKYDSRALEGSLEGEQAFL